MEPPKYFWVNLCRKTQVKLRRKPSNSKTMITLTYKRIIETRWLTSSSGHLVAGKCCAAMLLIDLNGGFFKVAFDCRQVLNFEIFEWLWVVWSSFSSPLRSSQGVSVEVVQWASPGRFWSWQLMPPKRSRTRPSWRRVCFNITPIWKRPQREGWMLVMLFG